MVVMMMITVVLPACSSPRPTRLRSEAHAEAPPSEATVLPATEDETPAVASALRTGSENTAAPPASCPPPLRLAPRELVVTWPQHVGARVAFSSRIDRTVDFTTVVIEAKDGTRFAVTLAPDEIWSGESVHAFTVGGSTTIRIHGARTLPQLFLDEHCST